MDRTIRQSGVLSADDLRVGAFVMVHSFIVTRLPLRPDGLTRELPRAIVLPMAVGDHPVLEIRAIRLPYVMCAIVQGGFLRDGPCMLDMRQVRLIEVGKRFAKALTKFKGRLAVGSLDMNPNAQQPVPDAAGEGPTP